MSSPPLKKAGQQHLKLSEEDSQKCLGIEGSAETLFSKADTFAHAGAFAKRQRCLSQDVQIQRRIVGTSKNAALRLP